MEKVIKTVYASLFQRTGVSYREKLMITTIGFMFAIMIPLLAALFL